MLEPNESVLWSVGLEVPEKVVQLPDEHSAVISITVENYVIYSL